MKKYRAVIIVLFSTILAAVGLMWLVDQQEQLVTSSEDRIIHTYQVILQAENLAQLDEKLVSSFRNFLNSELDSTYLEDYYIYKEQFLEHVVDLVALAQDNSSQVDRLKSMNRKFLQLTSLLEQILAQPYDQSAMARSQFDPQIETLTEQIREEIDGVLQEEQTLLSQRLQIEQSQEQRFWTFLYTGVLLTFLVLSLLNIMLLMNRSRQSEIQQQHEDTSRRFALAMHSTSDGVFDWNLETNDIFFSDRFKTMLGYQPDELTNEISTFNRLIHPEDLDRVWQTINNYLGGGLSEYTVSFRMKHRNGFDIWIKSRGKALFNSQGKAIRLVGAHTDITEYKLMEAQLREQTLKAEEANEAKSDFLAHMSHEIRTPLNVIVQTADLLTEEENLEPEDLRELFSVLKTSSRALSSLVNDILDLAKIESGELRLQPIEFNLSELFSRIISVMTVQAREKQLEFTFDYTEVKGDLFYGDDLRLQQVLINLISNAIKFTHRGAVTVKAYYLENDLAIEVKDTGIGIEPEQLDRIFNRFQQADDAMNRQYGGSGLGLHISKNLVTMMGGYISVESRIDEGTTFTVRLPRQLDSDAAKPAELMTSALHSEATLPIPEGRMLIVEDYEGNLTVLYYLLRKYNINFDIAKDGLAAVNMYKEHPYPLVLMDVQLPRMDGLQATSTIRKFEKENGVPPAKIIAMTAHAMAGDEERCYRVGMNAYISKPIQEKVLIQTIRDLFQADTSA